jgi:DNA-binding transcriptional LysR family regulator
MEPSDYVYEVYKAKSFSVAAKKNFVSQPALSAIVKKVEKELGVTLFDRSTLPISLTDAGKIYISALEDIRSTKKKMLEDLADVNELKTGTITVSGENFVSSFIMPAIIMKFSELYEGIKVELVESNSPDLRKRLLHEGIDLLIAHDFDKNLYSCEPLFDEIILLAVPNSFKINKKLSAFSLTLNDLKRGRHFSNDCPTVNIHEFENENFLLMKKGNDMQWRAETIFEEANFQPKVRITLDQLITSYNMTRAGMGITFITDMLAIYSNDANCRFYKLDTRNVKRSMFIGYKKHSYLTKSCKAFIEVAKQVYKNE